MIDKEFKLLSQFNRKMEPTEFDYIVVGAGINGSWSALHLAKQGFKTLLLDQFPLPHSRGSSHGQTRGIRRAYPEAILTKMMDDAYAQWHDLERASGTSLVKETGLLVMAEQNHPFLEGVVNSFKQMDNAKFDELSPGDLKEQFPYLTMGENVAGCYDPTAGILMADKSLKTLWEMFLRNGGKIRDNSPVKEVIPRRDQVRIRLNSGQELICNSVIICAGPWTNRLTEPLGWRLPLRPIKIPVFYFKAFDYMPHNFIFEQEEEPRHLWGLAELEYKGLVKICLHDGSKIDPDHRDKVDITTDREHLRNFITRCFPGVDPIPAIEESCIYTLSPDGVHILDKHPRFDNVVVGCGFSGSGFKLGPVTGKIMADLAVGRKPKYDMSAFRADRFEPQVLRSFL